MVGSALVAGDDVVDFKESGSVATWGLAAVPVAGQNLPPGAGRDRGGVAATRFANG